MNFAVLVDFGSTYTKMTCIDLTKRKVIVMDKCPSTVLIDASLGLHRCFETAKAAIGPHNFASSLKLATSSAAGGLRMAVVGLTKSVSSIAGRNASFSAGAKIVYSAAGLLSETEVAAIEAADAEILLLCGGYEGGNFKGLLHNAEMLCESKLSIPVIFAGNSFLNQDIRRLFTSKGKECFLAENIIPAIGSLNIAPTAEIIRNLFMKRITNMKGVGIVQQEMNEAIVPTPAAVLSAGELLSVGTDRQAGIGPLMMVDIGGATTDIYSYIQNSSYQGAKCIGAPEPYAKRTVEGDMGMRESSICLLKEVGKESFSIKCGVSEETLETAINRRITAKSYLSDSELEKRIDYNIACAAVSISARRHAGYVTKEFNDGCRFVQYGKNLTEIKTIVGTGGIIVNESKAFDILETVKAEATESSHRLLPETVDIFVDKDYVLFAAGLLRKYDEDAALAIIKQSLRLA